MHRYGVDRLIPPLLYSFSYLGNRLVFLAQPQAQHARGGDGSQDGLNENRSKGSIYVRDWMLTTENKVTRSGGKNTDIV